MATTSFIKYRSGGTKTAWTTSQAAGVMSNDDIDTNFATLNLNKLEAGDPTLLSVTANGSSTNTNLSLLGNNTLGAGTSSITTIRGKLKGDANAAFDVYGGDISGNSSYTTTISGGNRTGVSSTADAAGDLVLKGGNVTYGDGYNRGGDIYLYGGDIISHALAGSYDEGGGDVHIVSGTTGYTTTAEKTSGSIFIDVASIGANGTRIFGSINIGTGLAYKSGTGSHNATVINIGTSSGRTQINSRADFKSTIYMDSGQALNAYQISLPTTDGYNQGTIKFYDGSLNPGSGSQFVLGYYGGDLVIRKQPTGGGTTTYPFTFGADNSFITTGNITANGTIRAGGDIVAYNTSDKSLKTNIVRIDSALSKVNSLDGVTFNWNQTAQETLEKDPTIREAGVIAQQVQEVLPEVVKTRADGTLAVNYEQMVPLLIEAIKELTSQVKDLQNQLNNK